MKRKWILVTALALGLPLALGFGLTIAKGQAPQESAAPQAEIGTGFTYQGRLVQDNVLVNDTCDFEFELYSAATGGSQVGDTISKSVEVIDGLFTVKLPFGGNVFTGSARWLEIRVQCPGDAGYTNLGRQELTPTPYALALPALRTEGTRKGFSVSSPNIIGGHGGNNVTDGAVGATLGGGGDLESTCFIWPVSGSCPNKVTDDFGTVSGGVSNQAGDNAGTTFDARWATVGGGYHNTASSDYATVSGGYESIASGTAATVGGGYDNRAAGDYSYAAGRRAKALHDGVFVWADDTDADFASTAANQFLIRASGGVGIGTTNPAAQLHVNGGEGTGVYGRSDSIGVYGHSDGTDGNGGYFHGDRGVYGTGDVGGEFWGESVGIIAVGNLYDGGRFFGEWGVLAGTPRNDHEWGLYTEDKLYVGTGLASAGSLMLVAQNGDVVDLETGDVVVASGLGATFAESPTPIPLVRRAEGATSQTITGVVYRCFVAEEVQEESPDRDRASDMGRQTRWRAHSVEGACAPGDYLLLVVLGAAQVKVDAAGSAIAPGVPLTASSTVGHAAAARVLVLDGVEFFPSGVLLGTALEGLEERVGLIWVLVNPR